jgi:hypothetical protein
MGHPVGFPFGYRGEVGSSGKRFPVVGEPPPRGAGCPGIYDCWFVVREEMGKGGGLGLSFCLRLRGGGGRGGVEVALDLGSWLVCYFDFWIQHLLSWLMLDHFQELAKNGERHSSSLMFCWWQTHPARPAKTKTLPA